jgi:hypothetical protein
LNIKRIIFSETAKYTKSEGKNFKLCPNLLRQIAGRAGRSQLTGYVTALSMNDLNYIRECIGTDFMKGKSVNDHPEDGFTKKETEIKKAVIFPPFEVILDFASTLNNFYARDPDYVPDDLCTILNKFKFFSKVDDLYEFREIDTYLQIAKELKHVSNASLQNVLIFTLCPVKIVPRTLNYLRKYLMDLVQTSIVRVPMDVILSIQDYELRKIIEDLNYFEDIHNSIVI